MIAKYNCISCAFNEFLFVFPKNRLVSSSTQLPLSNRSTEYYHVPYKDKLGTIFWLVSWDYPLPFAFLEHHV